MRRIVIALAVAGITLVGHAVAAQDQPNIAADGTFHVPAFDLPLSSAMSPEAKAWTIDRFKNPMPGRGLPQTAGAKNEAEFAKAALAYRKLLDDIFIPVSKDMMAQFPVDKRARKIAGVAVEDFKPKGGASERNKDRVLINLHGGAFLAGAVYIGRIESAPVANVGKIRVVSVDYRQGPEHTFPAATDDVLAVFTELAKEYPARNIGIYGCSAGGSLTAQAVAAMIDKGSSVPGAIAMISAGAGGGIGYGDGAYLNAVAEGNPPPPASAASQASLGTKAPRFGYFSTVTPATQYLASPVVAPEALLAKFPPTLLVTGTRSFDMSPVLATHRALTRAGVEASLQVFDGMPHCFVYQHQLPEGKDANDTIIRFFDRNLGH